ncbi:MAG TPA: IS4 family transposase [Alphaproteobacteria bacterium]|nr:IS4 family transposase [Alphaproteobacteria bacterium]
MNRVCSIFAQILQLFPREQFQQAVKKHKAERHARGFTCWGQFVAMLFCQLGAARSLREICNGLAASEGKLRHLGIPLAPSRSTLAYANEHRPWELYETVFGQLLERCHGLAAGKKKFRFKNKLLSLDSTSIDLCASLFDWAQYKRTKGAVKVHLLLDHEGYLPCFAYITDGKKHDVTVGRTLRFPPGTIVVFDKGYVDYQWWQQMTADGVYFVTRLKEDLTFEVLAERAVPQNSSVRCDQDIRITPYRKDFALTLRRVTIWDEEKQEEITFLTNHLKLGATTIARIYKERWQIELFFKALKQLLRIKTFVGTSANALKTQIWTALIAMLVLKYLHLKSQYGWSLSNLVALVRQQLFVYRDLYVWLDAPFQAPPVLAGVHDGQLVLPF